jgi:hypothetical protein
LVLLIVALVTVILRAEPRERTVLEPPLATAEGQNLVGAPATVPGGAADAGARPTPEDPPPGLPRSGAAGSSGGSSAVAPANPGRNPAGTPLSGTAPAGRPPEANPNQPPNAAAPPANAARFAAVSGESCRQTADSGYYRSGWHTDWYARSNGGWTGDGCAGRMVAVPMSGSTTTDDPDNVIVWWFKVRARAHCAVSVHVPRTGTARDSAGAPATYFVYGSADATGSSIGRFTVDQVHNQGRWVPVGTFATSGQLSVRMVTRGIDWGPGREGAHLGVSALKLSC